MSIRIDLIARAELPIMSESEIRLYRISNDNNEILEYVVNEYKRETPDDKFGNGWGNALWTLKQGQAWLEFLIRAQVASVVARQIHDTKMDAR